MLHLKDNKSIIETKNLSFSFRKQAVLNKINIEVPDGAIYGYLGKNGAGKSTTIRLLLGLLKPPKESIYLFGKEFNGNRTEILSQVGNLIESPSYYANLTTYENLNYLSILLKCGKERIEEVIDLVNLRNARNKKVKQFSTGMKQRLGIAMAILHQPNLIILDEPLNGLDPEGVHDMRELILNLQKQGKTIFLSSHILSEIEKVCTHIGIIDKGDLIYQGKTESLLATVKRKVQIRVNDAAKANELINRNATTSEIDSNGMLAVEIESDEKHNELIQLLAKNSIDLYAIKPMDTDLESVFLSLTNNNRP